MKFLKSLLSYLCPAANTTAYPGTIWAIPGGITPDNVGMYGLFGFAQNVNALNANDLSLLVSSSQTPTLTGAQFDNAILDHSGAPGGAVTLTTPTAAQIIAALPNTIPQDGTCNWRLRYINDGLGQTTTMTAGANVTVTGTATIATNAWREFLVNVNVNAGTVTMVNLGGGSL